MISLSVDFDPTVVKKQVFRTKVTQKLQLELRQKLEKYLDVVITEEDARDFARIAAAVIRKDVEPKMSRVNSFVQMYAGKKLELEHFHFITTQLAAQRDRLREGEYLHIYAGVADYTLAPVIITDIFEKIGEKGKICFKCLSLDGVTAGRFIEVCLKQCVLYPLARECGFSKYKGGTYDGNPRSFVQLKLTLVLGYSGRKDRDGFPSVAVIGVFANSTQCVYNRQKAKSRSVNCPRGFNNRCSDCLVGYSECDMSCRPRSITITDVPSDEITVRGKRL